MCTQSARVDTGNNHLSKIFRKFDHLGLYDLSWDARFASQTLATEDQMKWNISVTASRMVVWTLELFSTTRNWTLKANSVKASRSLCSCLHFVISQKFEVQFVYIWDALMCKERRVSLICSKSRVASPRALSVPWLELCDTIWAVELTRRFKQALYLNADEVFYKIHSVVVLAWLALQSAHWSAFVLDGVLKIQVSARVGVRLAKTCDNPSDFVSGGSLV